MPVRQRCVAQEKQGSDSKTRKSFSYLRITITYRDGRRKPSIIKKWEGYLTNDDACEFNTGMKKLLKACKDAEGVSESWETIPITITFAAETYTGEHKKFFFAADLNAIGAFETGTTAIIKGISKLF